MLKKYLTATEMAIKCGIEWFNYLISYGRFLYILFKKTYL